MSNKLNKN